MVGGQVAAHVAGAGVVGAHQRRAAGGAGSRLVAACVRTCTSSPMATACAARRQHVHRPARPQRGRQDRCDRLAQEHQTLVGGRVSRGRTRRRHRNPDPPARRPSAIPPSASARRPTRVSSGPDDAGHGDDHTRRRWRGAASPHPTRSSASACFDRVCTNPSASIVTRMERRSGSQTWSSSMRRTGVQQDASRSSSGTTSSARRTPTSIGTPVSKRRTTSALAASTCAVRGPPSRRRAATATQVAAGRDPPVHLHRGASLLGDRVTRTAADRR